MKLGVEGLPAAEGGLLRTILRLSSALAGQWALVDEGPCDAVLYDDTVAGAHAAACARSTIAVPVVRRAGTRPQADHLERPVRAEDFTALLQRLEQRTAARHLSAPPRALSGYVSAPVSSREILPPGLPEPNTRGRLTRWPPAGLLAGGRGRIELATLLSRQARSARELAAATGQGLQPCMDFMAELDRHGLVLWETTGAPSAPAAMMRPARSPALSAAESSHGLLRSIRRRLGLS